MSVRHSLSNGLLRWSRGAATQIGAALLGACLVCVASNAAPAASGDLALDITGSLGNARAPAGRAVTPFVERFEFQHASLIDGIIYSPALEAPLSNREGSRVTRYTPAAAAIVGTASMYDPTDANDRDSGDMNTASGEIYDPDGWTAAIRTDFRAQFGGVGFGRNYRPTFALVESSDKRAIVRINDIGPLKRGRIIDLNKRAMRFFDPTLNAGLLDKIKVTPLAGTDVAVGPVDEAPAAFASRFDQVGR